MNRDSRTIYSTKCSGLSNSKIINLIDCIFFFESVMGNPQTLFPQVLLFFRPSRWVQSLEIGVIPTMVLLLSSATITNLTPFGSFPIDIRTIWVIRNSSKTVSIHIKNIIWENIQKIISYLEIQKIGREFAPSSGFFWQGKLAVEELQVVGNFFLEATERFTVGQPMSCQKFLSVVVALPSILWYYPSYWRIAGGGKTTEHVT